MAQQRTWFKMYCAKALNCACSALLSNRWPRWTISPEVLCEGNVTVWVEVATVVSGVGAISVEVSVSVAEETGKVVEVVLNPGRVAPRIE